MSYQFIPDQTISPPPKKQKHIFRWVFLAVQLLFLIWVIGGLNSVSDSCDGVPRIHLEACQVGTEIGAGIGIFMILVLWVIVDFILAISYLIFRKK